jgi:TonB family protein
MDLSAWRQWEGRVIDGKFCLRRYLGGSPASAVFLTEYGGEARQAAIKLVSAEAGRSASLLSRWEQAARLSHPHLIALFAAGHCRTPEAEVLYVVMEYAEEVLSEVVPERALTPAEAREMLSPALEALAYLHGQGFVHGRLKPSNLFAVQDQLKLSSDGLLRAGDRHPTGTPSPYDPPELAYRGASPAGDVWSLGVTLVEALTRSRPAAEDAERAALPEPFDRIARHALVRDPQSRCTVAEMTAWLREEQPAPRRPVATPRRVLAAACVAIVLTVAAVFGLLQRRPEPPAVASVPAAAPASLPQAPPAADPLPEILHQELPDVPAKARNTITGTLRISVRVRVDSSGSVADAAVEPPGASRYFAQRALAAARQWKFRDAASEWLLQFEFERTETRVVPVRVSQ